MAWESTGVLPLLSENLYGWPQSKPVLAFLKGGRKTVVICSSPNEDDPHFVRWVEDNSDGADVSRDVLCWCSLPADPSANLIAWMTSSSLSQSNYLEQR